MTIEILDDHRTEIDRLAEILQAAVEAGGSLNFVLPYSVEEARTFWRGVQGSLVFVARIEGEIVGTVQLVPAKQPNQLHRADVAKLMVYPSARRLGVARALMLALEAKAVSMGRTLLTLDTRTDDSAFGLYVSLGYTLLGTISDFALAPEGDLVAASFFYKRL